MKSVCAGGETKKKWIIRLFRFELRRKVKNSEKSSENFPKSF